jgi:vacuolar-type H+-ATPase subunit I/STV1
MENEELTDSLSAEAQAYFDSKGEAELKVAPEPEAGQVEEVETEAVETEDQPKEPKTVPLAALTKERQQAKELKAKLQEIEKQNAVLADRWNMVLQANQQPPQQEEKIPDPNEDIFAFSQYQARKLAELDGRIAQEANQQAQAIQHQQQERAVWDYWQADASTYAQQNPDFGNAAQWLSDYRDNQLKALSSVDTRFSAPNARTQQIEAELKQIVIAAAQQGISPAEKIYEIAQGYGYKSKPAPEVEADKLAKLGKAVDGSVSLSDTGGTRPKGATSAADIANLSPAEFESWLAKNGEKGFRKLMGG